MKPKRKLTTMKNIFSYQNAHSTLIFNPENENAKIAMLEIAKLAFENSVNMIKVEESYGVRLIFPDLSWERKPYKVGVKNEPSKELSFLRKVSEITEKFKPGIA
jgi:hypothetical protein